MKYVRFQDLEIGEVFIYEGQRMRKFGPGRAVWSERVEEYKTRQIHFESIGGTAVVRRINEGKEEA